MHSLSTHASILATALLVWNISACSTTGAAQESNQSNGKTSADASGKQNLVGIRTTPAGHNFWHYAMPDSDRSAVAITWATDLPENDPEKASMPRIGIDLMLNGGAGDLAAEQIIADFADLDSGSRLWVQPREISGFLVAPAQHMSRAAEIANLVLTQPTLDKTWFAREQKNLLNNATERQSHIFGLAWNLAREMALDNHTYKNFWSLRPLQGIASVTQPDILDWHARAFTTDGMSIAATGNADPEKLGMEIDRVLQGMPDFPAPLPQSFDTPLMPGKTVLLHRPDSDKSAIVIMGNLPTPGSETAVALQLGIGVLGQGKQSRLFKAVRSGLRATYGFSAQQFNMTRQHQLFHMSGEVETAKLQLALDEVEKTYTKFRSGGIGRLEFPIARRFYQQTISDEFTKPESVAYMLMNARLNGYGENYVPQLSQSITALDRKSVNQVISQSLPEFDSLLRIIVTPDRDAIEGACVINDIDAWESCS